MLRAISDRIHVARVFLRAGIIRPGRPDRVVRAILALERWGPTLAAGYISLAARYPDRTAVIDERGTLTFEEVDGRTSALADALRSAGLREGQSAAIMCRNHRGFIDISVACSKLGVHALYLNTAFAAPQVSDVVGREDPGAVVYDEEFAAVVRGACEGRLAFVACSEGSENAPHTTLEELIAGAGGGLKIPPPSAPGRTVILTSGTTGTPKGANRASPDSLDPAAALLSRIPLRAKETTVIAAPLFHSWGFAHLILGTALGSTVVLHRRYDPEQAVKAVAAHRATALVVVPVMLQRILELEERVLRKYDCSSLRVIASSGSALPGPLATRVMDAFGEKLYNLYGSTEVAWATIATPEELRSAPGTAGRPPRGTVVKIVGEDGRERPREEIGRIFVGNELLFEGYTGGGDRDRLGALMSTGDVGHFDSQGRLFIDGRDDDMIVSGGENVFPSEVEDLLSSVPGVRESAVVGVPDEEFGQRLRAFVALQDGAALSEQELKDHVKSNLATYKVPREIVFVRELPRNATGKVLKRQLLPGEAIPGTP